MVQEAVFLLVLNTRKPATPSTSPLADERRSCTHDQDGRQRDGPRYPEVPEQARVGPPVADHGADVIQQPSGAVQPGEAQALGQHEAHQRQGRVTISERQPVRSSLWTVIQQN